MIMFYTKCFVLFGDIKNVHKVTMLESGRGKRSGDVEKEDQQSYRRPYIIGKPKGKDDE